MGNRERELRARGEYPTQDTSRMATVRVKQEEEADSRMKAREKYERKERRPNKLKGLKQGSTSSKDITNLT